MGKGNELVMVSAEGCSYCKLALDYLNSNKIPYRVVDYRLFAKFKEDGHLTVPQFYYSIGGDYKSLTNYGYSGLIDMSPEFILEVLGGEKNVESEEAS